MPPSSCPSEPLFQLRPHHILMSHNGWREGPISMSLVGTPRPWEGKGPTGERNMKLHNWQPEGTVTVTGYMLWAGWG